MTDLPMPTIPAEFVRPHERQVARAVKRVEAGKSVDASEIAALLAASGEYLDRLMAVARRVREAGLADAGRAGVLTYSKKVALVKFLRQVDGFFYAAAGWQAFWWAVSAAAGLSPSL